MLSIGALSKRVGVKIPTIRYYEQVGLLPEPERSESNQRRYDGGGVDRLGFIRHARDLGFSIQAIRELIYLSEQPDRSCIDATRIAGEQLTAVRERIARLKRLEAELDQIASGCSAGSAADCYVLKALSDHAHNVN
jgi:DNA-binding transcriptional MerR regulator